MKNTDPKLLTFPQAQRANARCYRAYARRAPWNSQTRQGWLELARTAERHARIGL